MSDTIFPYSHAGGVQLDTPWHGTSEERTELVGILIRHYGQCACSLCPPWNPDHIHACQGHAFYNERDDPGRTMEWTGIAIRNEEGHVEHTAHYSVQGYTSTVFRVDRLLFARRMIRKWRQEEGIEHLPSPAWWDRPVEGMDDRMIEPSTEDFSW
jgi:hypothetical protein